MSRVCYVHKSTSESSPDTRREEVRFTDVLYLDSADEGAPFARRRVLREGDKHLLCEDDNFGLAVGKFTVNLPVLWWLFLWATQSGREILIHHSPKNLYIYLYGYRAQS